MLPKGPLYYTKGLASYCKAETTFTFYFTILPLSRAFLSINDREMKSESGFSFAMASQPFHSLLQITHVVKISILKCLHNRFGKQSINNWNKERVWFVSRSCQTTGVYSFQAVVHFSIKTLRWLRPNYQTLVTYVVSAWVTTDQWSAVTHAQLWKIFIWCKWLGDTRKRKPTA